MAIFQLLAILSLTSHSLACMNHHARLLGSPKKTSVSHHNPYPHVGHSRPSWNGGFGKSEEESEEIFPQFKFEKDEPTFEQDSGCGQSRFLHDHFQYGIVGGLAALPHEFPWLVRLQIRSPITNATQLCSASIVSEYFLVTAAHCVLEVDSRPEAIHAIVGEHDLTKPQRRLYSKWSVKISEVIVHPDYSEFTNENDIALLQSSSSLLKHRNGRNKPWVATPICLPNDCDTSMCGHNTQAVIAGWGAVNSEQLRASKILQKAIVPITDRESCAASFSRLRQSITDKMVCAGLEVGGIDSCFGDSGGPLMTVEDGSYNLCGITSFGDGCGNSGVYGVYTRVCTVLPWLNEVLSTY